MISFLEGKIIAKEKNLLLILTPSGVGYEVRVSPNLFLQKIVGEEVKLFTHLHVREDIQELFGMLSFAELSFFKVLVAVSGVGPRSALNILSLGPITEIREAIARGDINFLTRVSGIGKKIAERIIVELKSKVEALVKEAGDKGRVWGDVMEALVGMGYAAVEIREALRQVKVETKNSSQLLREALKILNKRN